MRNEPQGEPVQGIDTSQSAFARARADTRQFLSTPSFWFMEVGATALAGTASLLLSAPPIVAVVVAVAAPLLLILLAGLSTLGRAPLMQRNETRKELVAVRERLRPKLRITEVNKSYDPDWRLQEAMIYTEYLRVTVTNHSKARASNCSASLLQMVPMIRGSSTTEGHT